ncbi:UNVERIFIED_CONTAM: hypothetical protein FKN15_073186 [Acipenser sinensis]
MVPVKALPSQDHQERPRVAGRPGLWEQQQPPVPIQQWADSPSINTTKFPKYYKTVEGRGLCPKRTLRVVLWTVEEQGVFGVEQYYQLHKVNISNFDLVMESDTGTFAPFGLQFTGSSKTQAIMKRVRMRLQPISVTGLSEHGEGTDIDFWKKGGVPDLS